MAHLSRNARMLLLVALVIACQPIDALATNAQGRKSRVPPTRLNPVPIDISPDPDDVCEGFSGAAFALCNVFCEVLECDVRSLPSCEIIRRNFDRLTLRDVFPCELVAPSPTATVTRTSTSTAAPTATATLTQAADTPTNTPTSTPTGVPTGTASATLTPTATDTPVDTATATATSTGTAVNTFTATTTPTATNTGVPTGTAATATATNTPVNTATATNTSVNTATATNTPVNTATATATGTGTAANTSTATTTPTATNTGVPTGTAATATVTNTPVNTATATNTSVNTATATATSTGTAANTSTATNTPTATNTGVPTGTAATSTATATTTNTPTSTSSPVNTSTATNTPTSTSSPVNTSTATNTPTATNTGVPTGTSSATSTVTPTPTSTPLSTNTATVTPSATPTPTDTPVPCPLASGSYTLTQVSGGILTVDGLPSFPFPAGGVIMQDVGTGNADCVHETVVPFPGGFDAPAFCIPALGFTTSVDQTGCGIGRIDSNGGSDFTIAERGDTSSPNTCALAHTNCTPGSDSNVQVNVTVGNAAADICSSGTANASVSVPVFTTTWLKIGQCPDVDGVFSAGDVLIVSFPQTLDFTTDSTSADWTDLDPDGCCIAGAGPGSNITPCTAGGAGGFSGTGTCINVAGIGVAGVDVTTVASGTIGSSGSPLYDLTFLTQLPNEMTGPAALQGATCTTPPAIDFAGTVTRCIGPPASPSTTERSLRLRQRGLPLFSDGALEGRRTRSRRSSGG